MAEAFSSRFHAFNFRFGRRGAVRGFDVRALMPEQGEWTVITHRVEGALALVEHHSPLRFVMLQRDIKRLWITGIPSRGVFVRDRAMCVLDFDYVIAKSTRIEDIALTLVHEGTHARLARAGFGYDDHSRPRIERLCIGSEFVVARRFPDGGDLVDEALERLAWDDDAWSAEAIRDRHMDALHDLGWAGRLGYRFGRSIRPFLR